MRHQQTGASLLESMVAIVIAALGILGIIGIQANHLLENKNETDRAFAIQYIQGIAESILILPNGQDPLAYKQYLIDFRDDDEVVNTKLSLSINQNCLPPSEQGCNPADFAKSDVSRWKNMISMGLPEGDLSIFEITDSEKVKNENMLGVMVAWKSREKIETDFTNSKSQLSSEYDISCPSGKLCHVQLIPLLSRCLPNANEVVCIQ